MANRRPPSPDRRGPDSPARIPNTDPLRYAICPVIEDPTDGGIAPDQFLAQPLKTDGTPVEPAFLSNFESLRLTGDWE